MVESMLGHSKMINGTVSGLTSGQTEINTLEGGCTGSNMESGTSMM
jgi:hypothetical protein